MDRTHLLVFLIGFVVANAIGIVVLSHLTTRLRATSVKDRQMQELQISDSCEDLPADMRKRVLGCEETGE